MAATGRGKTSKQQNSIVPVIFAIGVIGWGFFAIDRLTAPERPLKKNHYTIANHKPEENQPGTFKKWLGEIFLAPESTKKTRPEEEIPVVNDFSADSLSQAKSHSSQRSETTSEENAAISSEETIADQNSTTSEAVYIYLYQVDVKTDDAVLRKVLRPVKNSGALAIRDAIKMVIAGPDTEEKFNNFIDSFKHKPLLNNVDIHRNIVTLDFADEFGASSSLQTLKYQLKQLYTTVSGFESITAMRITHNGKQLQSLGGDGLNIPSLITQETINTLSH